MASLIGGKACNCSHVLPARSRGLHGFTAPLPNLHRPTQVGYCSWLGAVQAGLSADAFMINHWIDQLNSRASVSWRRDVASLRATFCRRPPLSSAA